MIALSLSLGEPYKPETARARRKGQLKCAAALLDRGADVHVTDGRGYSALHHAAFTGDAESSMLPLIKQILAMGADVNARTHAGMTPLSLAEERGHAQVAAALKAAGATPSP
jgi:ankyrin repeat protein